MAHQQVISEEQRRLNQALHQQNDAYGNRADGGGLAGHMPEALKRMHELGICNSVLDYGTGKGKLVERLRRELPPTIQVMGYDPSVELFSRKPDAPVDILTCLDVLEHIEMDSIDAVLRDIYNLTRQFCYLVIDLQPAIKTLPDGRNAHILLAPAEWWVARVSQLFPCIASFPILHEAGPTQKVVIAAAKDARALTLMYSFLIKLKVFDIRISGGSLAKLAASRKA